MKKSYLILLIILSGLITKKSMAQFTDCGCSQGADPYWSISVFYATDSNTGCATPSAGSAFWQIVSNGQVVASGYTDSQSAADDCQLNTDFEVWSGIFSGLNYILITDGDNFFQNGQGEGSTIINDNNQYYNWNQGIWESYGGTADNSN